MVVAFGRVMLGSLILLPIAWRRGALHSLGRAQGGDLRVCIGGVRHSLLRDLVRRALDQFLGDRHPHRHGAAVDRADSAILRRARTLGCVAYRGSRHGIRRRRGLAWIRHDIGSLGMGRVGLHAGRDARLCDRPAHHPAASQRARPFRSARRESAGRRAWCCSSRRSGLSRADAVGLVLASMAILGVVCTAVAMLLMFYLVSHAGASRAAVITYINPAVAALLGVSLLHERLGTGRDPRLRAHFAGLMAGDSRRRARSTMAPFRRRRDTMPRNISVTPLWMENAPMPPLTAEPCQPKSTCSSSARATPAFRLRARPPRAGRSTLVLDAGALGAGCSSRNGGQVAYSIKPSFDSLKAKFGADVAFGICREGLDAVAYLRALAAEQIDCDWRADGCFFGAHTARHFTKMVRDAAESAARARTKHQHRAQSGAARRNRQRFLPRRLRLPRRCLRRSDAAAALAVAAVRRTRAHRSWTVAR